MSIFEAVMIFCFGVSWPFSIYKSYRTKSVKGKSLVQRVVAIPLFLQHYWNLDRRRGTISRMWDYGVRRMRVLWSGRRLQARML